MADRDRDIDRNTSRGSEDRVSEGERNTEIKRETDVRNSLGPVGEEGSSEENVSGGDRSSRPDRESTRGMETE